MFHRFPVMLIFVLMLLIPQVAGASDCSTHVVLRGENLFRISLRYGVSMSALAAANNISNINLIYAGQVLHIPCAGSTSTSSQTTTASSSSTQPAARTFSSGRLNCAGFRATSPVDGLTNGNVTFYWDPPKSSSQVARYQVRILNAAGFEVGAYEMLNVGTSMTVDVGVGAIGPGNNFVWYAVGVTADKRICQTQLVYLPREWTQ